MHATILVWAFAIALQCQPAGPLTRIPLLPEASGIAASRHDPARLWAINDSGEAVVTALDAHGFVSGRVSLAGATVEDWEAIAVAACPAGSCLYIGDIGDNNRNRSRIAVYRLPEPSTTSGSVAVTEVFHASYPDGPHDAETLLVSPDGTMYVVTKGHQSAIYRFPKDPQSGATSRLERVGGSLSVKIGDELRITDGAVSQDGEWTVLRTSSSLAFYRSADFFSGQWRPAAQVDLAELREPQGEGVAIGKDGMVFVAGESGGKGQAGTFGQLSCRQTSESSGGRQVQR
jgi:hypothetical protein